MSRGTLFNLSSPSAAAIGEQIKATICKKAKVSSPGDNSQINENTCLGIIKYAEFSLLKLKGEILTSQMGSSRRLCV